MQSNWINYFFKKLIENAEQFYMILNELGFSVNPQKMIIYVQKSYGRFEIELINTNVHFIPNQCLKCDLKCKNWRQSVCIQPVHEAIYGWSNVGLNQSDLLLLSKAIALKYDLIDIHIKNQINNILTALQPQNIPDIPEQTVDTPMTERHMLQLELRTLFRNRRKNYCIRQKNSK